MAALAQLITQVSPDNRAEIGPQVAESILWALENFPKSSASFSFHGFFANLMGGLKVTISSCENSQKVRLFERATRVIDQTLINDSFDVYVTENATLLVDLANLMSPDVAYRLCGPIVERNWRMRSTEPRNRSDRLKLESTIVALLTSIEAETAKSLTVRLTKIMVSERDLNWKDVTWNDDYPRAEAELVKCLQGILDVNSCRLTDQQFVDLLKMPTCFKAGRRVVLDRLGANHRRRFANAWEFERFAAERGLGLDWTTRAERPLAPQALSPLQVP